MLKFCVAPQSDGRNISSSVYHLLSSDVAFIKLSVFAVIFLSTADIAFVRWTAAELSFA